MRQIEGIITAVACERPRFIPLSRPRGAKAFGLRFERATAKAICHVHSKAKHGQWFEFEDLRGHGYCQPDIIIPRKSDVIVVECKLTDTAQAQAQINGLYKPVLEHIYGVPCHGIVIVRHLTKVSMLDLVCDTFDSALLRANGVIPTLHWLGKGRI